MNRNNISKLHRNDWVRPRAALPSRHDVQSTSHESCPYLWICKLQWPSASIPCRRLEMETNVLQLWNINLMDSLPICLSDKICGGISVPNFQHIWNPMEPRAVATSPVRTSSQFQHNWTTKSYWITLKHRRWHNFRQWNLSSDNQTEVSVANIRNGPCPRLLLTLNETGPPMRPIAESALLLLVVIDIPISISPSAEILSSLCRRWVHLWEARVGTELSKAYFSPPEHDSWGLLSPETVRSYSSQLKRFINRTFIPPSFTHTQILEPICAKFFTSSLRHR